MKSIQEVYNQGQKEFKFKGWYRGMIQLSPVGCIGKYEFIGNPEYALVETLSKDKETREDFLKWLYKKEYYDISVDIAQYPPSIGCGGIEGCDGESWEMTKQMLVGYWQEYILERWEKEK